MPKWKIYTPDGVQDILFDECYMKRNIEAKLRELFRKNGYFEIETPLLEFFDTFTVDEESTPQESMFKFFDQQGRILVLRPDLTIPVARIAASKLKDAEYPLRISYIGNTFRYNESGGGRQKEFTQAGIELLGEVTPESDAEVISIAINAVRTCGLDDFQIDIGQVGFFKGLMEEAGLCEQDVAQMRMLIDRKDFIGIEEIVGRCDISSDIKKLILDIPRLSGDIDVIAKVRKIVKGRKTLEALDYLENILKILEDYTLNDYVSVDLGMVQSLNYYTGIIFRGFTHGIGFPILSGGRYDNLVEKFGLKLPATGFSLGVNLVMNALERQQSCMEKPQIDSLIYYEKKGRKTAFEICNQLRLQGLGIQMDITMAGKERVEAYARAMGIGGIIGVLDEDLIEIHNLENNEIKRVSRSELLK